MPRWILITIGVLAALWLIGWLGLKVPAPLFPALPADAAAQPETIVLPAGLPAPVERFYRTLYGDEIPVIETAVVSGRVGLWLGPIRFPGRFHFTHEVGRNYRHDIDLTWFGIKVMSVDESFLNGQSRLNLPWPLGLTENEPKNNQAANLGLWGESLWFPAIYLTDPRLRWEPLDQDSAILVVPGPEGEERFVMRFDPETGLHTLSEVMRYRDAADTRKILWIPESVEWGKVDGLPVPRVSAITWFDMSFPWATWTTEEMRVNLDVSKALTDGW